MANLNTKTISDGVGDILAVDGGITGSAKQVKDGDGTGCPIYIKDTAVGIGASTPGADLHIKDASGQAKVIIDCASGNDSILDFHENGASKAYLMMDGTNDNLEFWVGGSERMQIASDGNVGIGCASGGAMLQIAKSESSATGGTMLMLHNETSSGDTNAGMILRRAQGVDFSLENNNGDFYLLAGADLDTLGHSGDNWLTVKGNTGLVGLNNSSPSLARLNVAHAGDGEYLYSGSHTHASGAKGIHLSFTGTGYDIADYYLYCGDGSGANMVVGGNGRVGIGVSDPDEMLEVKTGSADTGININGGASKSAFITFRKADTEFWWIGNDHSNSDRFYIKDGSGDGAYLAQNSTATPGWTGTSDLNLKTDISVISDALSKVNKIRGVNFKWKKYKSDGSSPNTKRDVNRIGVIAQEINEVLPEAVDSSVSGEWGVAYTGIIPLLIEAVKELSAKVKVLENK